MFEDDVAGRQEPPALPGAVAPQRGSLAPTPRVSVDTLIQVVEQQAEQLGNAAVAGMSAGGGTGAGSAGEDAALVDLIAGLSRLVSAAEACSARAVFDLSEVRGQQQAARKDLPFDEWRLGRDRSVAAEVGLARKESGHRGKALLGLATVLCSEMQGASRPW